MVFSSIPFLFFFFPLFLILYYIVPFKIKNYILLIFSLVFYAWGEPVYIFLMIFSSFINYLAGLLIDKFDNKKKRKLILVISIIINILILGFFKYADFFIEIVNGMIGINIDKLELGLPIGISFFTFQAMSYVMDVYRKEVVHEKNFFIFMTYISMFPQLIAGPIVRYETVSKELYDREINLNNFSLGLKRFMLGLFKKVLIANNVGYLFSVISGMDNLSVLLAWLGIIAFTIQIYFDFSGYSDMAIGMGRMLGFNYLENFNYPYIAKSITDFWRRWHISLSTFFRDYVYIPLGGSRVGKYKHIRNIMIVWMLTGLWHGASFNFILWGLYYGILLILEKKVFNKWLDKLPNVFRHIYALFFIMIGWLIFAFDDMSKLLEYGKTMFFMNGDFINQDFIYYFRNYFIILIIASIFSTPIYKRISDYINKSKDSLFRSIIIMVIYILLFIITIAYLVSDTYNPFLYFRF